MTKFKKILFATLLIFPIFNINPSLIQYNQPQALTAEEAYLRAREYVDSLSLPEIIAAKQAHQELAQRLRNIANTFIVAQQDNATTPLSERVIEAFRPYHQLVMELFELELRLETLYNQAFIEYNVTF